MRKVYLEIFGFFIACIIYSVYKGESTTAMPVFIGQIGAIITLYFTGKLKK